MKTRTLFLFALLCAALVLPAPAQDQGYKTRNAFAAQTATGTTASFNVSLVVPTVHAVQLVTAGAPTTCTYKLEGSLDGTTWVQLGTDITCTSTTLTHIVDKPVEHIRGNLSALTGGSSPSVTFTYLGVRR